jgi:hypothetical protein
MSSRSRRTPVTRLVAACALGCATITTALAGIAPADAAAHTGSVGAEHSLSFSDGPSSPGVFIGGLSSAAADCLGGRSVTLYRSQASSDAAVAGPSFTNAQGGWSQSAADLPGGSYYAVAAAKQVKVAGHRHDCEAARSNAVTIAPDSDGDGSRDPRDNCPGTANASQQDTDGDWRGDACDPDADGDGYPTADGDCADTDRTRYPGRPDTTLNGIDDDCDGSVDEGYNAGIAYSDTYLRLIAQFPPGYADSCDIAVFLNPGGGTICDTTLDIQYFYPNGSLGARPWDLDPSSPSGWSIMPGPCDGLTDADYQQWLAYVDADPSMSDPELQARLIHPFDLYLACYVPFDGF